MRCLSLAEGLREKGASIGFLCRKHPGNLVDRIEREGFRVFRIALDKKSSPSAVGDGSSSESEWPGMDWQTDAVQAEAILERECRHGQIDWLIVDHYGLDARWERQMRSCARKIMVIDDLANRPHDCDLLLDQNFYRAMDARYNGLTPGHCQRLLGPSYALIRQEFLAARKRLRRRRGGVNRILVFFAGADPTNETAKVLEALRAIDHRQLVVDVVVAQMHLYKEEIRRTVKSMPNATYHCQPKNLVELMVKADFSVGACGSTAWERCCLGLPALVAALSANQQTLAEDLAEYGAVFMLRPSRETGVEDYVTSLRSLLCNPVLLERASRLGENLVDGRGIERSLSALDMDALEVCGRSGPMDRRSL